MFEVSEDAKEFILARLDDALEGRPELRRGGAKAGLRLSIQRGKAYLSLALPRPTDRVVTFMGRPLLIFDDRDISQLGDVCLTVSEGPRGTTLAMVPRSPDRSKAPPTHPQSAGHGTPQL